MPSRTSEGQQPGNPAEHQSDDQIEGQRDNQASSLAALPSYSRRLQAPTLPGRSLHHGLRPPIATIPSLDLPDTDSMESPGTPPVLTLNGSPHDSHSDRSEDDGHNNPQTVVPNTDQAESSLARFRNRLLSLPPPGTRSSPSPEGRPESPWLAPANSELEWENAYGMRFRRPASPSAPRPVSQQEVDRLNESRAEGEPNRVRLPASQRRRGEGNRDR